MLRVIDLDPFVRELLATGAPKSEVFEVALSRLGGLCEDLLFFGVARSRLSDFTIECLSPLAKA
jgi:hypothetical protein